MDTPTSQSLAPSLSMPEVHVMPGSDIPGYVPRPLHEDVTHRLARLDLPTPLGPVQLQFALMTRYELMASPQYFSPGWRRFELGLVAVAVRAVAVGTP